MKQLITFLTLVICLTAKAQITFPAPGATWHYETMSGGFSGPYTYTNTEVKYIKDTLFMGKNVKVLGANISYFLTAFVNSGNPFIYTSNDSVFFYNSKTLNQWQLLYSFNTPVGQSWQLQLQDKNGIDTIRVLVDSVKYTLINSVSLKTLFVTYTQINHFPNSISHSFHSVIYDRIGDTQYLFNYVSDWVPLCDGCTFVGGLLCYQDSTFALYQPDTTKTCNYTYTGIEQFTGGSEQLTLWPNPASTNLQVAVSSGQIASLSMYDVLGSKIDIGYSELVATSAQLDVSSLNNGVYFIEVKTKVGSCTKKIIIQH